MLKHKLNFAPGLSFKTFLNESATVAQHLKKLDAPFLNELKSIIRQELQKVSYFQTTGVKYLNLYINFFTKVLLDVHMGNPNLNQIMTFAQHHQGSRILAGAPGLIQGYWRRWGDYIIAIHDQNNGMSKFNNSDYAMVNLDADVKTWHEQLALKRSGAGAEGRTLIDLSSIGWKGWKWISLDKGYCSVEAKAAGHCGNANARPGDNILSLRDPGGYPHLTFIVNEGVLGESKGRGNDKPVAKYHPAIMALLLSEHISSIRGGGYLAANNFEIKDLSEEDRKKLLTVKPDIDYIDHIFKNSDLAKLSELFNTKFVDMKVVKGGDTLFVEKIEDWNWGELYKTIKRDRNVENFSWLDDSYENFDYNAGSHEVEQAFHYYINPQLIKAIEDYCDENYDEDWREEGKLADVINNEDGELADAIKRAMEDGMRVGAESEAYKDVIKQLDKQTDNGFWFDKDTWTICITLKALKDLYRENSAEIDSGEALSHFYDFEYSQPHYGYDGFDEEAFKERLEDSLSEIGVKIKANSVLTKGD